MLNKLQCYFFLQKKNFDKKASYFKEDLEKWTSRYYLQLAIFNVTLLLLILLRSAGYFEPILTLSINLIIFTAIILAVTLLRANSKIIFILAILFLILAIPFKYFSYLEVWAERTVVYAFQAMVIGFVLMVVEILRDKDNIKN